MGQKLYGLNMLYLSFEEGLPLHSRQISLKSGYKLANGLIRPENTAGYL